MTALVRLALVLIWVAVSVPLYSKLIYSLLQGMDAARFRAGLISSCGTADLSFYDTVVALGPWIGLAVGIVCGLASAQIIERFMKSRPANRSGSGG